MGAESDVGGGSGKTLQSHGQLPPGKMRIGCGVELGSARTRAFVGRMSSQTYSDVNEFFRINLNGSSLSNARRRSLSRPRKLGFSYHLSPHLLDRSPSRVYSPPTRFLPRKPPV